MRHSPFSISRRYNFARPAKIFGGTVAPLPAHNGAVLCNGAVFIVPRVKSLVAKHPVFGVVVITALLCCGIIFHALSMIPRSASAFVDRCACASARSHASGCMNNRLPRLPLHCHRCATLFCAPAASCLPCASCAHCRLNIRHAPVTRVRGFAVRSHWRNRSRNSISNVSRRMGVQTSSTGAAGAHRRGART